MPARNESKEFEWMKEFRWKRLYDVGEAPSGSFVLIFDDLSYLKFSEKPIESGEMKVRQK